MKYLIWLLPLTLLTLSACRWQETKDALKQGDALKASIESFEKDRQKLSTNLVSALEEAGEELTTDKPDLPQVSKDFEKDWTGIQNRYDKLQADFTEVGTASKAYFAKLDELSGSIQDAALRKEELAKNAELQQRWQASYTQAEQSISRVTEVIQSGHDFHMVLVASSIRQKLEQNVDELNRIAVQAKALLSDLEAFTEAGRQLVDG
jgi:chromosome segregation ATPase